MKVIKKSTFFCLLTIILVTASGCYKDYVQAELPPKQTCPGIPEVEYGGEVYPTVLIGDRCWLAKNLNVGKRIDHDIESSDNDTIQKYCMYNLEAYCDYYGGLYQWDELMQYDATGNGQGICPDGWRIPTVEDYALLFNYTQGAVKPLEKQYVCWYGNKFENPQDTCNRNGGQTGFDLLPAGYIDLDFSERFFGVDYSTNLWIAGQKYLSIHGSSWGTYEDPTNNLKTDFKSVRCVKTLNGSSDHESLK